MTLTITDLTPPEGFERLVRAADPEHGLIALICIHSTVLGPAAGGCRRRSRMPPTRRSASIRRRS